MKKKVQLNNKILIVACVLLVIAIIGTAYALYMQVLYGEETNTIVAGTLSINLHEHEYIDISGKDAIPLTKETALSQTNNLYNFDLENDGNINSKYTIYLEIEEEEGTESIPTNCIRYILTKNNVARTDQLLSEAPTEQNTGDNQGKIILDSSNYDSDSKVLVPGEENANKYSLRLWIDENATTAIANHVFKAKLKIVATQTDVE